MTRILYEIIRSVPAYIGLGLPLIPIGLTRFRFWAVALFLVLCIIGFLSRKRAPRVFFAIVLLYLISCIALIVRTVEIVNSASTDVWLRAGVTAILLIGIFIIVDMAEVRVPKFKRWRESAIGEIASNIFMVLLTIIIIRLGQWGLWENPSVVSGVLVAFPIIHFKPRRAVLAVFAACSVIVIFEWHGYMLTKNIERVPYNPPKGIMIDILDHGDPQALQGARFFDTGKCKFTMGSFYMGEMYKTYRYNTDGSELVLVQPDDENNNEAVCSVIELCEEGVVITGSDEARFIRFSDLHTGKVLKDIKLKGQPTFIVLSPDRKYIYASIINPGLIVRIDLATRNIDREFEKYSLIDPSFSGINNIIIMGDRIYGAYSSYFTIDNREGHVFSVNLELGDYRPLFSFRGSWGIVAPDDGKNIFFKVYSKPDLYRVAADGSGGKLAAEIAAGYHYFVRLAQPSIVVINHWATGEFLGMCTNDFNRRFYMNFGGMGRPMTVVGNRIMTAVPAGYATLTFEEDLCD